MTVLLGFASPVPRIQGVHVERLLVRLRLDLRLVLDLAVVDLGSGLIEATLGPEGDVHHDLCRAVDRCLEMRIGLQGFAEVWSQVSGEPAVEPYDEVVLADSAELLIFLRGREGLGLVALLDPGAPLGLVLARLREAQRELDSLVREIAP